MLCYKLAVKLQLTLKKSQYYKEGVTDRKDLLCFVLHCGSYKNRKVFPCGTAGPAALPGLELTDTSQSQGIISPGEEITFSDRMGKVKMESTRD